MNHIQNYFTPEEFQQMISCQDLYQKGLILANRLFENKVDKAGEDYRNHLYRVAAKMKTPKGQLAGLLHDMVEDIPDITFEDLAEIGIPLDIIEVLKLVTKNPKENNLTKAEKLQHYQLDIDKIINSGNPIALELKIADVEDNYNPDRLTRCSEPLQQWFTEKYDNSLKKLNQAKEKIYVRH